MRQIKSWLCIASCILGIFLSGMLFSCDDEENYTSSPNALLQFSADTVRFDTVFTTIGSSTAGFKVYNRNSESLLIPSIRLAGEGKSGFRVNVDGMPGVSFSDVELRKKDSLYVFVEVTVNPRDENNPFLIRDSLIFRLAGGAEQRVQLEAYGQDMIVLRGKVFERDTLLSGERPYVVYDSLLVDSGVTLRLSPGTRLHFHSDVSCRVYGTLKAEGTLEQPVVFRGDRLDNLFSYLPYDRLDKQWGGLVFHAGSYDNELRYTDIHSGNFGIVCDSSDAGRSKLLLENSVVHNVAGDALQATACRIWVGNSQLTNAGGHCANIRGGDVQFVYSTLANFYPWTLRGAALRLSNEGISLERADFRSCIVTGYSSSELLCMRDDSTGLSFNYSMSNTLLNMPGDSIYGERYVAMQCDSLENEVSRMGNFPRIDTDIFYYDFSLDSLSVAVGAGSVEDAVRYYPCDRLGRSRLDDGMPDAGAYEWFEQPVLKEEE